MTYTYLSNAIVEAQKHVDKLEYRSSNHGTLQGLEGLKENYIYSLPKK